MHLLLSKGEEAAQSNKRAGIFALKAETEVNWNDFFNYTQLDKMMLKKPAKSDDVENVLGGYFHL